MTVATPVAPAACRTAPGRDSPAATGLRGAGVALDATRTRMRELLETEPYLFGPGVYDPMGAQLAMYHGFKAVYFSGYSFAIGHLGTTDMDLYSQRRDRRCRAAHRSARCASSS